MSAYQSINKIVAFKNESYNPFIHGTTSAILVYLPKTNFELISPIEMMRRYQLAPLSGEIAKGGLSFVTSSAHTAFGRAFYPSTSIKKGYKLDNYYHKGKIISNYAQIPFNPPLLKTIQEYYQSCNKSLSCNNLINELSIYTSRARQWGLNVKNILSPEKVENILTKNILYYDFLIFISKQIYIDDSAYTHITRSDLIDYNILFSFLDSVKAPFSYNNLGERLSKLSPASKKLLSSKKRPTKEEFSMLISDLQLPKSNPDFNPSKRDNSRGKRKNQSELYISTRRIFLPAQKKSPRYWRSYR